MVKRMDDFICLSTGHAALCGMQLELIERNNHYQGTMLREVWQCPCCWEKHKFENQDKVKSAKVAQGRAFSRPQPRINLELVKGAKLEGINIAQLEGLFINMGMHIADEHNLRRQMKKVGAAIKHSFEEQLVENRKEHVAMTRAQIDYPGDVLWEKDGIQHSTCIGDICIDGTGCTRSYNHRHRCKQSAFIVCSITTRKLLALVVSNVS
jgi:hypothetical protein